MKLTVNSKCIGCNVCVDIAEAAFEMKDGKSEPKKDVNLEDSKIKEDVEMAVSICPVQAIEFTEN